MVSAFHERINKIRADRGITQVELAKNLGITSQTLSYIMNGREPKYDMLVQIAKFFDVSIDYLLGLSAYQNNRHSDSIEKMFSQLPESAKASCMEIQIALIRAAETFDWAQQKGFRTSNELFFLLVKDLMAYITAYQNVVDNNTAETNLETSPHFFLNGFVCEISQTMESISKVADCIYGRGNIIADAVFKTGKNTDEN